MNIIAIISAIFGIAAYILFWAYVLISLPAVEVMAFLFMAIIGHFFIYSILSGDWKCQVNH